MDGAGTLLFGGTFDPPHRAHAELPPLAAGQLGCDLLVYIPAAINPLKADSPPTAAAHRRAMLELAVRDVPRATISIVELERAGPSYFVDTVRHFRAELGADAPMRFLIGSDQALEFDRWKDWETILDLADPAVMIRPPHDRNSFDAALDRQFDEPWRRYWRQRMLDLPRIDCTATDLRERLHAGADVGDDLDPAVLNYIREHHLYGT